MQLYNILNHRERPLPPTVIEMRNISLLDLSILCNYIILRPVQRQTGMNVKYIWFGNIQYVPETMVGF
jgi:hypothetical protein